MPDDAQPDEGQGTEATGSPYDSYLQTVPEQAREAAEAWFKDTSKGLDAKLQEAAELSKSLGPYKEVQGLSDYPPDQLTELLGWHKQMVSDPESFQQWIAQEAEAAGFTKAEAEALEDAEGSGELSPEKIQQIIDERLQAQLGPLQEQQQELSKARTIDTIEQDIRSEWGRLESENKITLSDEQKAMILDLGINYEGDESWVQHGYDRFKEITAEGQRAFVAEKANQPQTPITTGGQEGAKPPTGFKEAGELFRERLRQAG